MENNILKKFSDVDFGLEDIKISNPKKREVVKGIVVDQSGAVAIFNKRIENEYKLPGGVINDLSIEETFLQEIKIIEKMYHASCFKDRDMVHFLCLIIL